MSFTHPPGEILPFFNPSDIYKADKLAEKHAIDLA